MHALRFSKRGAFVFGRREHEFLHCFYRSPSEWRRPVSSGALACSP
jgi:hypothetical protein